MSRIFFQSPEETWFRDETVWPNPPSASGDPLIYGADRDKLQMVIAHEG